MRFLTLGSLLALVFACSAFADATVICVSNSRDVRGIGRVKGIYYTTLSFDSKGLTYWNEYSGLKKTFSNIARSDRLRGVLDIEAGNAGSFLSLHIQTATREYLDAMPSGSKVKTWFSLTVPAEGEFLEEPAQFEEAECTVQ